MHPSHETSHQTRQITVHSQLETDDKISAYLIVMQLFSLGQTQSKGMVWSSGGLWDRVSLSKYIPYFYRELLQI